MGPRRARRKGRDRTVWKIEYSKAAENHLKSLSHEIKRRVKKAVEEKIPTILISGKYLQHNLRDYRQLRVGKCRVIYMVDVKAGTAQIIAVLHRSEMD